MSCCINFGNVCDFAVEGDFLFPTLVHPLCGEWLLTVGVSVEVQVWVKFGDAMIGQYHTATFPTWLQSVVFQVSVLGQHSVCVLLGISHRFQIPTSWIQASTCALVIILCVDAATTISLRLGMVNPTYSIEIQPSEADKRTDRGARISLNYCGWKKFCTSW